jgi:hypothetical protein
MSTPFSKKLKKNNRHNYGGYPNRKEKKRKRKA